MTHSRGSDAGRSELQVTLATLALIPFGYGLAGMLMGPRNVPGNRIEVDASFDSEFRFVHAFWFATAPVIWSTLARIEQDPAALNAALGTVVLGGFARMLSWREVGRPRAIFVGGIGLELVVIPGLWAWKRRVVRAAEAPAVPA